MAEISLNDRLYADRFCPICKKNISADICYEIVMSFTAGFKIESIPEVDIDKNAENEAICDKCPYSDLS
ncbi:MAG: hypothetical protein K2J11_12570 [Oscillospiraceae bacterium]|nr:hypothetical protein [Oscillospiraceae bacterium]